VRQATMAAIEAATARVLSGGILRLLGTRVGGRLLSARTLRAVEYDLCRFTTRVRRRRTRHLVPSERLLHLGCGGRQLPGWLNVDVRDSDLDVDLAGGRLPWRSGVFEAVVSQHVIEHLELYREALPLLREVRRVLRAGGELWVSCPDIEKICRSYLAYEMKDLVADRQNRMPDFNLGGAPSSQMANHLFHQDGEHVNLFDWPLLEWILREAGFSGVRRVTEADLLARFPGFPERRDESQTIYVAAVVAA
jgi:predicted SAM-dependent methyltransferase